MSASRAESDRAYYERNRERLLAKQRAYREANPEQSREWRKKNRAHVAASRRAYYLAHREEAIGRARANRSRTRGAVGFGYTTGEMIRARFAFFGHKCRWCDASDSLEVDHVIPLSRGGAHLPSNIVPACPTCNRRKNNKPLTVWLAQLKAARASAETGATLGAA